MENTLENKAKFFAQYWGQKVFKYDREGSGIDPLEVGNVLFIPKGIAINYSFLELKPVSQISDEDALEVTKNQVYRYDDGRRSTYYEHYTNVMKENAIEYVRNILRNSVHFDEFSVHIYDYLRSKAYALPWMGLSVEQLIEYGWIKLKEV